LFITDAPVGEDETDSFFEKLVAQAVKNLKVSVKNIHCRYEDMVKTDRQTDQRTDRQTNRQNQTNRQTDKKIDRQTDRHTDRQADRAPAS